MMGLCVRAAPILALAAVLVASAACRGPTDSEQALAPTETTITLPNGNSLEFRAGTALSFSPTGHVLVYAGRHENVARLYLRAISGGEARALVGTEGAANPFFSPDGRWLGFFADGKLKKLLLEGAHSTTPTVICDASGPRGASWGEDGEIIFGVAGRPELLRVSAEGGQVQPVTRPVDQQDFGHRGPHVLPGGKAVLFAIDTGVSFDHARLSVLSLETGEIRPLMVSGHSPSYAAGHLVFARDYTIFAARFDLRTFTVTGPAVPAVANVSMHAFYGLAHFSIANDGLLAYLSRDVPEAQRSLVWVDRTGTAKPVTAVKHAYDGPRVSPNGAKLAFVRTETPNDEVWTYDLEGERFTRLSDPSVDAAAPTWSPDSRHVTFSVKTSSGFNVFEALADGEGSRQQLLASPFLDFPASWSPDGRTLAFARYHPRGWEVWMLERRRDPRPWIQMRGYRGGARFSPDGRSIAYAFAEPGSGRSEVYIQPYPGPGHPRRVSLAGGEAPVWSPNGRELFYLEGQKLMSVQLRTSTSNNQPPRALFEGPFAPGDAADTNYDVAPDGKTFIMVHSDVEVSQKVIRVAPSRFQQLSN